jgi:hypothetical protein
MTAEILRWPDESLEHRAYTAAASIPTFEANDANRLGYHLYLFLRGEIASLQDAVHLAQVRTSISREEVIRRLLASLESTPPS